MLKADLHSHSHYSNCGMHSVMEIINHAKNIGLEVVAITDHGHASGGKLCDRMFDRFINPVNQVTFLKGIECNVLENGSLDIPRHIPASAMDIVLFGLHSILPTDMGAAYYTDLLIKTIKLNPCGDIITHPDHASYPLEFERLIPLAKKHGVVLELNNACTMLKKADPEITIKMLSICKQMECAIAVNSDAHTLNELGRDDAVRPFLEKVNFPEELIVNSTPGKALAFIEERKKHKRN
jgi:putative hydrolase